MCYVIYTYLKPSEVKVAHVMEVDNMDKVWGAISTLLTTYKEQSKISARILVPKSDVYNARIVIHRLINELNLALRRNGYTSNIRYLIYHHDSVYFGVLLLDQDYE